MFRQYRQIEPREFIVAGMDLAWGLGDYTAVQFLSKTKLDVPLVFHSKEIASANKGVVVAKLQEIFDITGIRPVVAPERQGGIDFAESLINLTGGKFDVYHMPTLGKEGGSESKKPGWDTTSATRPVMLEQLKNAVDNKQFMIYDKPTINEMFSFVRVQTTAMVKAQAEKGAHDDLIMSLAIAWQLYQRCPVPADIDTTDLPSPEALYDKHGFY